MAPFDPYHIWLGIPPEEQPPNHYRLLAIPELESNPDVIDTAAERQTVFLRTFQAGDQVELAEQLLNEVSAARVCLLSEEQKAEYDRQLQAAIHPAPIQPAPIHPAPIPPPNPKEPPVVVTADPPAVSVEQPAPPGRQPRQQKRKVSPFWQQPRTPAAFWHPQLRMLAAAVGLVVLLVFLMNVKTPSYTGLAKKLVEGNPWQINFAGGSIYIDVTFSPNGRFSAHDILKKQNTGNGKVTGKWSVDTDSKVTVFYTDPSVRVTISDQGSRTYAHFLVDDRSMNEGEVVNMK